MRSLLDKIKCGIMFVMKKKEIKETKKEVEEVKEIKEEVKDPSLPDSKQRHLR